MSSRKRSFLLNAVGLLAITTSNTVIAAEEPCGPATMDTEFTLSVPCLTVEEGQPAPADRYRRTLKYNPEFIPFNDSDNIWKWDLTEASPATCSASANCSYMAYNFTQVMLPQVNFEKQPFYAVSLLFDGISSAWYGSSATEDPRLTVPDISIDRLLDTTLRVKCGEPPTPVSDFDGDKLDDAYEACIGTNKYNSDSDGDGYDDLKEATQGSVFLMNPSVADIPVLRFQSNGNTKITLNASNSSSQQNTISSTSASTTTGTSSTDTTSHTVSVTMSLGLGALGGPELTMGYSNTTEKSRTRSQENTTAYEQAMSATHTKDVTVSGGNLSVSMTIANTGQVLVALRNISLYVTGKECEIHLYHGCKGHLHSQIRV